MSATSEASLTSEQGGQGVNRRWLWALVAVAAGAWLLRAAAFFNRNGAFGYPVDYDEGVYFAASALLFRGELPYKDFVFVHPPGALLLWGPVSVLASLRDVAGAFALARWGAATLGALSAFLVGRVALRTWGPVAGVVAALVYATYPELVIVERGPFLEPVLNLACLTLANVWLVERPGVERPRWLLAGVLCGVAISVKVLGGIWLAAAVLSRFSRASWRAQVGLVLAAGATVAVLVGPFVVAAPSRFLADVLVFQSMRPGDGDLNRWSRLHELLHERRLVGVGLALLGLGVAVVRTFRPAGQSRAAERFFAVAYLLTGAAFLSSPSYWNQYNAFLAASESVLAGLGAGVLYRWSAARGRVPGRVVAGVLMVAVLIPPWKHLRESTRWRAPEVVALAKYIRQSIPPEATLCAFEPAWALAGGRLPAETPGAPLVVDSYALMLESAVASGERFANAGEAFKSPESQGAMVEKLARCRFVIYGSRGAWQLTPDSQEWFHSLFVRRFPVPGEVGVDVWEQLPPSSHP